MRLLRTVAPLALAACVATTLAGTAAAGGDAGPPVYPSLVNVQMVRVQTLIDRAALYEDKGETAKAVTAMNAARSHMHKAWSAAKFVIDNAPPPVAGDGAYVAPVKRKRAKPKAHASGGAIPGASPFADQYTTAVGVLTLEHTVAVTALGMLDTADATLLPVLSTTIFAALNDRDTAVAYIGKLAPPPVAGDGSVHAHASDTVIGWATVMPGVLPYVDDELQVVDGLQASLNLSPGRKRILDAAEVQDIKTERNVNRLFPPLPAG